MSRNLLATVFAITVFSLTTVPSRGAESYTIDWDTPVSAYLALDERLPQYPDRDLALLWHEQHGWSAAVDTSCGEDLLVIGYLGGPAVAPRAGTVRRFVTGLRTADRGVPGEPPLVRTPGRLAELTDLLRAAVRDEPVRPMERLSARERDTPQLIPA